MTQNLERSRCVLMHESMTHTPGPQPDKDLFAHLVRSQRFHVPYKARLNRASKPQDPKPSSPWIQQADTGLQNTSHVANILLPVFQGITWDRLDLLILLLELEGSRLAGVVPTGYEVERGGCTAGLSIRWRS